MPTGAEVRKVNYDDQASLVEALQGHDALVITMGVLAPPEQQTKLIDAAAAANVPWVLPNEYGYPQAHPGLRKDIPIGEKNARYRAHIETLGKSSWIGITCGFWYEYSLAAGPHFYGFDLRNRAVTFFDDGITPINTSTWPQCGRGVAALLSLKIAPEAADDDASPCLERFRNRWVYLSSFRVCQRDMFDSVMRVTGTTAGDWRVGHEASVERYAAGMEAMRAGDRLGFAQLMYTRVFFRDGCGDYETYAGLQNGVLGLPVEDLDAFTGVAVEMAQGVRG